MATNNNPRLEIEITAISTGLTRALQKAKDDLNRFNTEVRNIRPDSFNGLISAANSLKQPLRELAALSRTLNQNIQGTGVANFNSALQQSRLDAQNYRTEIARLNRDLAALRLANAQNQQGQNAAAGSYREAQQRLTALGQAIRNAAGGFTSTSPAIQAQIAQYRVLNEQLKKFDAQMGNHQRNVGNYANGFLGAIPVIGQFTSVLGAVGAAVSALQKSFDTNLKLDALNYSLKHISGSTSVFSANMDFLRSTSNRLGLEFVSTATAFKSWQGAAKFSNLTGEQSRSIFESVANAGAKMKLSTEQVQGTFLALSQMMSKGKVQAEELRGQLGERLPGAFALAAKAMGVTQAELNKMLETGKVMADDFLPRFAKQLDITFGNDKNERIDSLQASVNRLTNEFTSLWESDRSTSFFSSFINGLANATSQLNKTVSSNSWKEFFLRLGGGLSGGIVGQLSSIVADAEHEVTNAKKMTEIERATYGFQSKTTKERAEQLKAQKQLLDLRVKEYNLDKSAANKRELVFASSVYSELNRINQEALATGDGSGIFPSKGKVKKGKQQTLTSSLLAGLRDEQGDYYDQKLGKIREEYEKLVDSINKSKGSKADIAEALGLAKTNRQFDELKVSAERFAYALKDIKALPSGISASSIKNASSIALPSVLTIPDKYRARKTPKNLVEEDFTKQFQSTLRRGLASTFGSFFDSLSSMSDKSYEIEQKYASLRASATRDQIAGLNKMEALERKINNGLTNMLTKIGSTFGAISGNMLTSALSTGIASGNFKDLKAMFTGDNKSVGYGSLGSLIGSAVQGSTRKTDTIGQTLGGALAGAGTGAAIGSIVPGIGTAIGAVGGAIIGGISGLLGSSKAKKEEELLRLQLEEQKKMVALQERQAALSYSSSVVGQRINEGIISSIDRNAFGELTAKVSGKDLILAIDRTKSGRG
ncbi:MAG: tape measure protein [Caudoviricetes sp.]|nr:MAG: tape measure protein [Caudoviricetes sp.]